MRAQWASAVAIMIGMLSVTPARADIEFWLDNQSSVPIRAIVQEIPGVNYLRPGQKGRSLAEGGWFATGGCGGTCLQEPYHVRFKHISDEETYCLWEITYTVYESSGTSWGWVAVDVKHWDTKPGMRCETSGQRDAKWHSTARSEGVYLIFTVYN